MPLTWQTRVDLFRAVEAALDDDPTVSMDNGSRRG